MHIDSLSGTRRLLLCGICLLPSITLTAPAFSADGDIIILREVQPRSATRPPLVPDPNPHVVNPKPNSVINQGLRGMAAPTELSDSDFAGVTGGHGIQRQLSNATSHSLQSTSMQHGSGRANLPASPAASHSGAGLGNLDGQINRSLQQGLQPLQGLFGR